MGEHFSQERTHNMEGIQMLFSIMVLLISLVFGLEFGKMIVKFIIQVVAFTPTKVFDMSPEVASLQPPPPAVYLWPSIHLRLLEHQSTAELMRKAQKAHGRRHPRPAQEMLDLMGRLMCEMEMVGLDHHDLVRSRNIVLRKAQSVEDEADDCLHLDHLCRCSKCDYYFEPYQGYERIDDDGWEFVCDKCAGLEDTSSCH
jgi:hypothetical protein